MASGDNQQQWGYAQFNTPGQATGQAGNFLNQGFGSENAHHVTNANAFTLPQQWQPQDDQFIHDNGFPSFQSQGSSYPVQHYAENTGHAHAQPQPHGQSQAQAQAQSHQHPHPQTYSAPISLDNPPDISWDYDFSFDSNPLTGMAEHGLPFESSGGLPSQSSSGNGLSSTSSFTQGLPNTMANQQQHFSAATSSSNMYAPNQSAAYGRTPQQSPPQAMAQAVQQPVPSQRHVMDYQQPPTSQHQQAQLAATRPRPQNPQSAAQYPQPLVQHPHRQSIPLQTASPQPNQLHNIHHLQQAPRTGTPQSVTQTTQPSQSPFQGRNVPPFSMQQQQTQLSGSDGRASPARPFSAPQQNNMQTKVAMASPSLSNSQTDQNRFFTQQLVPIQQSPQSPVPLPSKVALSNIMPNTQQKHMQPTFQAGTQTPKVSMLTVSATPPQQPFAKSLGPPRILHQDDQRCPLGSRYVAISTAPPLPIKEDAVANNTVDEIPDPSPLSAQPFGRLLPPGQAGQTRTLAFEALRRWTKAVEQDDVAVQNEWEQRLRKYLGRFCLSYSCKSTFSKPSIP